jgi:hypothetical protein
MLGNLTVDNMLERLNIKLSTEDREWLGKTRQNKAENVEIGKWHCFDIPFTILCGDTSTAKHIFDILSPYGDAMEEQIRIAIDN